MTLWPLLVYAVAVVLLVAAMVGVSYLLGERHKDRETDIPYESGVKSTGTANLRLTTRFYLVALLFVLFDLEAVFIFAWAIAVEPAGWQGYAAMLVFVALLTVGLIYEWRQGALDWGVTFRARLRAQAARVSSQNKESADAVVAQREE